MGEVGFCISVAAACSLPLLSSCSEWRARSVRKHRHNLYLRIDKAVTFWLDLTYSDVIRRMCTLHPFAILFVKVKVLKMRQPTLDRKEEDGPGAISFAALLRSPLSLV